MSNKITSTLSYEKLDGSTSHGLHNVELPGDKSKSIVEKQTNVETAGKTSASKSHLAAEKVMTPNELANKYQHISNTFVSPSTYGNLTNKYPAIPVLSNAQSGEFNQQLLLSCYDVSPGEANRLNRSVEAAAKPLSMTPQ
ncbi:hypothetical protein CRYUN_Cryun41cG0071100 [Craigia yunnanensis]